MKIRVGYISLHLKGQNYIIYIILYTHNRKKVNKKTIEVQQSSNGNGDA